MGRDHRVVTSELSILLRHRCQLWWTWQLLVSCCIHPDRLVKIDRSLWRLIKWIIMCKVICVTLRVHEWLIARCLVMPAHASNSCSMLRRWVIRCLGSVIEVWSGILWASSHYISLALRSRPLPSAFEDRFQVIWCTSVIAVTLGCLRRLHTFLLWFKRSNTRVYVTDLL